MTITITITSHLFYYTTIRRWKFAWQTSCAQPPTSNQHADLRGLDSTRLGDDAVASRHWNFTMHVASFDQCIAHQSHVLHETLLHTEQCLVEEEKVQREMKSSVNGAGCEVGGSNGHHQPPGPNASPLHIITHHSAGRVWMWMWMWDWDVGWDLPPLPLCRECDRRHNPRNGRSSVGPQC